MPRFVVLTTSNIPNAQMNSSQKISLVMFYSLLPPVVNPFIYCIRIKEIRQFFIKCQNTNMTIVLAARNRQGGVVNTHSGASRLSQWLVFGAECSFPPPRDSIRNAALIPEPVACRLCQGAASGPSSPGGASATAVLVSLPAHARAEQQ
ncbi:hypothetical protein G5714_011107 [Onychostoma macrolepis]|uniref:Uncharacterized protein n=1 Tax=Onychostoma macrolepis TaxID=369639 RepID=A0A7J6CLZ0_9TELE|nr:hypothetical protein G5714_011107 [Onychostoma macrolepis]